MTDNLSKTLITYCLHNKMAKNILVVKLGVSLGTLKNWEFGRTHPNRKSWPTVRAILGA
jgi:DNA-binding transcriptional regulator YiaG